MKNCGVARVSPQLDFWGALFLVFLCKGREVLADYISSASRLAGATADAVAVMIVLTDKL